MTTELAPVSKLPDISEDAGFLQLAGSVLVLSAQALLLKEGLHRLKKEMEDNASTARDFADKCEQAGVDPQIVSLVREAADALQAVADATGDMATAADLIQNGAQDVKNSHETEYRGVYEAVQASPYDQPKPGFLENR